MQWSKDDGSNSSYQKLSIVRLTCFEKVALSQFQLYIEAETMTQCFLCCNWKKTIVTQYDSGKENVFCILHMLGIHNSLRKWILTNIFNLHLKKMNLFGIHEPIIKIAKSELIFEQYRMALNPGKYDIEFQNDDAIKRNRLFFYLMQKMLNWLDGFYSRERFILIDAMMEDKTRKQIAAEWSKYWRSEQRNKNQK